MDNFSIFSGDNLGGSQSFQFINVQDVNFIPDAINKEITSPVILNSGAVWSDGYASQNTLNYEEIPKRVDAGTYFKKKLSGFYPKICPEALNLFNKMLGKRFILIVKDNNGYFRLVGTLREPIFFKYNNKSKKSSSGRNGFDFSFEIFYPHESPFYNI